MEVFLAESAEVQRAQSFEKAAGELEAEQVFLKRSSERLYEPLLYTRPSHGVRKAKSLGWLSGAEATGPKQQLQNNIKSLT
jgi:hypothetical protein